MNPASPEKIAQPPDRDPSAAGSTIPAPTAKRRRRWYARWALTLLEAVGAVAALLLLVAGMLGVWLARGPLEVDWLTPSLVQALNGAIDPLHVTIMGTSLRWSPGHASVELVARQTRLLSATGDGILTLPSLAVSLSVEGLIAGQLRPTRLSMIGPRLRVTRSGDGVIDIFGDTGSDEDTQPSEPITQLLRSLALQPRDAGPLARLSKVTIEQGNIVFDDHASGVTWRLKDGDASLTRSAAKLAFTSGGVFSAGTASWTGSTEVNVDLKTHQARFSAKLNHLNPADLAPALPASLAPLGEIQMPLTIGCDGVFDVASMQVAEIKADIDGSDGAFVDGKLAGGRLAVHQIAVAMSYDSGRQTVALSGSLVDPGQTGLETHLTAAPVTIDDLLAQSPAAPVAIAGSAAIRNLPLDRFAEIWPPELAADARSWILENLSKGVLKDLSTDYGATLAAGPNPGIVRPSVTGKFTVEDATVDYLSGLPKLQGVDGTASFNAQQIRLSLTNGKLLGLTTSSGTVTIDGLDEPHQHIAIDLGIRGPSSDVLTVLDAKRLRYASALGLDPTTIKGDMDGALHFAFELKKQLPFDEIDYGAKARLTGLGAPHVALGQDLESGNFDLLLDRAHVSLDGTGTIGQVPASLKWKERISGHEGPLTEVNAAATMDIEARRRFGVDVIPDIVQGPVGVDVVYNAADKHQATAMLKLALTDATLTVSLVDWSKQAGVPGTASFDLQMTDDHIQSIEQLRASAPNLDFAAALKLNNGQIAHATIDHLKLTGSDITGSVDHIAGSPWHIALKGTQLDATSIRKSLLKDTDATSPGPALVLDVAADHLVIGEGRAVANAVLHADVAQHAMNAGSLTATIGQGSKLDFHLDPVSAGGKFAVTTDDFGAFFKLAGITDDVIGGSLAIDGTAHQDGDARRFSGHAEGKDYRIVHMPFVARLASLTSLDAVRSLLGGNGIPFTALKADFDLERGRIDLHNGRAYGGAFGVNADGWFDTKAGTLGLQGTIIPAYTLNSALGNVPVLGDLVLGGEGQGLFGANVSVHGTIAEPTLSVNALSALAPGFIRNLFLFDAPGGGSDRKTPE